MRNSGGFRPPSAITGHSDPGKNKVDENVVRWSPRSLPTHQIMRPVEAVEVMKPHRSDINRLQSASGLSETSKNWLNISFKVWILDAFSCSLPLSHFGVVSAG